MKQGLLRKLKTDGTRWLPMFLENTNSDSSYHGNKQKAWKIDVPVTFRVFLSSP